MQDVPINTPKLAKILEIIASNLSDENIPFAAIGALALGIYGLPRHTSDIDLMVEGRFSDRINKVMRRLGYTCFQETEMFAQYDSELGMLGRIDFMFVSTQDGKEMLSGCIHIRDDLWGQVPVVQPTDYIALKLMSIANNPDRTGSDEADIVALLKGCREDMLPDAFEPLQEDRLNRLSEKFEQKQLIQKLLENVYRKDHHPDRFSL